MFILDPFRFSYSYAGFPEKGWKLVRTSRTETTRNLFRRLVRTQRSGAELTRSSAALDSSQPNPNVSVPASEQLEQSTKLREQSRPASVSPTQSVRSIQSIPPPTGPTTLNVPSLSLAQGPAPRQKKQTGAVTGIKVGATTVSIEELQQHDRQLEAGRDVNMEQGDDDNNDDNNEQDSKDSKEDEDEQKQRKELAIQLKNTSMSTLAILLTIISILLAFTYVYIFLY